MYNIWMRLSATWLDICYVVLLSILPKDNLPCKTLQYPLVTKHSWVILRPFYHSSTRTSERQTQGHWNTFQTDARVEVPISSESAMVLSSFGFMIPLTTFSATRARAWSGTSRSIVLERMRWATKDAL